MAMALAAECYMPQLGCEALYPGAGARLPHHTPPPHHLPTPPAPKDYSLPLHVDCSVEYELPDCAKPPQGVKIEPLLMIHPAHFRRLDSLRRCPFVNNLPVASGGAGGRAPYELPPHGAPLPLAKPARSRASAKVKESPGLQQQDVKRWTHVAKNHCCKGVVQYGQAGYRLPEAPDPYWGACGGPAALAQLDPYAPKEGDTLENSFGKCPQQKYRSARQKTHPYVIDSSVLAGGHTALAQNCDKTFEMLQGNRLISPFHAKMFSGEGVYQNYPIVMYK